MFKDCHSFGEHLRLEVGKGTKEAFVSASPKQFLG